MSWFDSRHSYLTRTRVAVAAALLLAPALAGCGYQPLYGSGFAGTQGSVADQLRAVDVALVPGRVGQEIRNELIFMETGGREAAPPKYRLEIAMRESVQATLVNLQGTAAGNIYQLNAEFKLISIADQKVILAAKSGAQAQYQQETSTFANVRARRDAEDRAARVIADSIRTQVAAFLSQTG
jgi:LPS-assembly lipoprotein